MHRNNVFKKVVHARLPIAFFVALIGVGLPVSGGVGLYHVPVHAAVSAQAAPACDVGTPGTAITSRDLAGTWSFVPKGGTPTTIQVPGGGWHKQGFTIAEATYTRAITIPDTGQPQVTKIEFGAVNHEATLSIDGTPVGTNMTAFTPSIFDITNYVEPGKTYTVTVDVKGRDAFVGPLGKYIVPDAAEWSPDIPQGIFRSACLRVYPQTYIADAFVRPSVSTDSLSYDVWVTNASTLPRTLTLSSNLTPWNSGKTWSYPDLPPSTFTVGAGQTTKVTVGAVRWGLGSSSYWWPNVPYTISYTATLHNLNLTLSDGATPTTIVDTGTYRFGFKEVTQQKQHFYLNGIPVNFRGDNLQGADYDSIDDHGKGDAYDTYAGFLPPSDTSPGWPQAVDNYLRLNYNMVRIHQEPASPYMFRVADEKGLMILDETAIRGSGNLQDFTNGHDNMVNHARALVLRDRNHPSVVRWSQDNEPRNDDTDSVQFQQDLYNAIMADDPTRPVSVDDLPYNMDRMDSIAEKAPNFTVIPHYVGGAGHFDEALSQFLDRPYGQGEYLFPSPATRPGFEWIATATQAMRRQGAADLRPYALYSAWASFVPGVRTTDMTTEERRPSLYGADNLPDPWGNSQIQRVQAAFNPVLVADKDYWEVNKYSDANGDWPVAANAYGYGQTVSRTLDIYNDTFAGTTVDVSWDVRADSLSGAIVDSGTLHRDVPLGSFVEQPITFVTPTGGSRFYLILRAGKNGQELFRESSEYFVLTPRPNPGDTLVVDDSVQGNFRYGFDEVGPGWSHCTSCDAGGSGLYNASSSADATSNDTMTMAFPGTGVTLYGVTGPGNGIAGISIDGGPETSVDFYSPTQAGNRPLWTSLTLPPGDHTITVRVTGTKNTSSTGASIVVDRMDILSSPPPGPPTIAIPTATNTAPTIAIPTATNTAPAPPVPPTATAPPVPPATTFAPPSTPLLVTATPLPTATVPPLVTITPLVATAIPAATGTATSVPLSLAPTSVVTAIPATAISVLATSTPVGILTTHLPVLVATATTTSTPPLPIATATTTRIPSARTGLTIVKHSNRRVRVPALPLVLSANRSRIMAGDTLTLGVHTVPRARVTAILQVSERKVMFLYTGRRRKQVVRIVTAYRLALVGAADAHGQFAKRMTITYRPVRSVTAALVVTASVAHRSATRTMQLTIQPRRASAWRHAPSPHAQGKASSPHARSHKPGEK